jgi:hypothetical protein
MDKLIEAWAIRHTTEEVKFVLQVSDLSTSVLRTCEDLLEYDSQLTYGDGLIQFGIVIGGSCAGLVLLRAAIGYLS